MTRLRFPERVATDGNDKLNTGGNQLTFGMGGDDTVYARVGSVYNFMAGGEGDDTYVAASNSIINILDTSGDDTLRATGIGIDRPETAIATVADGQHVIVANPQTGQQVTVANWSEPGSTIETFEFADGTLSFDQFSNKVFEASGFIGDVTADDLVREQLLPAGTTSSDLAEFVDYIEARESTLAETQTTLAQAGVDLETAERYILERLDAPDQIYEAADTAGLSAEMVAGLVGVQSQQVVDYFADAGLDAAALG